MHRTGGQATDTIAAKPVEFHEATDTFRTEFDSETRPPTEAVIAAVAAAKDADETALPPLFERIDPDALESLFAATSDRTGQRNGNLTFDYAGCQITVNSHGTVIVDPSRMVEAAD